MLNQRVMLLTTVLCYTSNSHYVSRGAPRLGALQYPCPGLPAPQAFSPCTSRIHRMVCLPSPLYPPRNTPDDSRSAPIRPSQFECGLSAYAHTEGDTATPP